MWKCENCLEEGIKDKYKHCWNCGTAKPVEPVLTQNRIVRDIPKIVENVPLKVKVKPEPVAKEPVVESPPIVEKPVAEDSSTVEKPTAEVSPTVTTPTVTEPETSETTRSVYENDFLSGYDSKTGTSESPPSIIGLIVPVLLWLVAFIAVAIFAYYSNQKTTAFDQQVLEDAKNFQAKDQFKFPEANLPTRRNQAIVEGNITGKVLPINRQNNELYALYYELPDDLRPANLDEAKNLLWLDCKAEPAGRVADGSPGFQEKCNSYLVERETSKIIGVQDFLGISPALSQPQGNGGATGKVPKERYLTYLRQKQPEAARSTMKDPSDSPNHHYLTKSEFVYAIVLLCGLGAIGLGWLVFKIKSAWTST